MVNKNNDKIHKVVVILPYVKNKVLMQLRDLKSGISFPGQWGFFGGSITEGETPDDCAKRELFEEIGYKPDVIHKLSTDTLKMPSLGNTTIHSYCCQLRVPLKDIELNAWLYFGLFSIEEVITGKLYSSRVKRVYPVIKNPYVINTIKNLFEYA